MKYLIGFGNYSMGDDSIGLRIVESVASRQLNKGFEAVELGHDALRLFSYFNSKTELILITDCVEMGLAPGEFRFFSPFSVKSNKALANFSTHESDLLKVIELAESLGEQVPEIEIMGIQPEKIEQNMELSPSLSKCFDLYIEAILNRFAPSNGLVSPN